MNRMIEYMKERDEWLYKIKMASELSGYEIKTPNQYKLWTAGFPKDVVLNDKINADWYNWLLCSGAIKMPALKPLTEEKLNKLSAS